MSGDSYTLGDRRYLKQKVVASYERLWRGEDADMKELFLLKANAHWLQSQIAGAPAKELFGVRKSTVRKLFAECCARLNETSGLDVQSHAMETLSGLFLGIGSRTFHDPVADVLELLCGIEAADGAFEKLFAHVKFVLTEERRGAAAAAVRRAAVRLLLSLTAAASDLHRNILIDLLMPQGFDQPSACPPFSVASPFICRANAPPACFAMLLSSHGVWCACSPCHSMCSRSRGTAFARRWP